jgi:hypothetical protein
MAIALTIQGWASPQTPPAQPPDPVEVANELKALERKWTAALARGDVKALDEIFEDNYLDTDEEGNQTDKAGVIAAVKAGDLKIYSAQLSAMKIHSYGFAAVVTGHMLQAGTFKGKRMAPGVSFTNTFVLDGTWKLAASHRSAPRPPAATPEHK